MNTKILLVLILVGTFSVRCDTESALPKEVRELAHELAQKKEVASITIDGLYAGTHEAPSCSFCNKIKDELFKHDTVVHSWYTAFGNCRCAEHHELVRSLAWLAAPVGGATVGFIGGSYGAQQLHLAKQLVALPCALVAAWCASTLNSRGYGWLSDMLDRRADAAAVIACPTAEDKERVITYLQEVTKQHDDSAQAEQEYQLFCVNAYDVAQSNLCSFITIHIQFPVPWLSSSDEIKRKLQQRITYLERALQP